METAVALTAQGRVRAVWYGGPPQERNRTKFADRLSKVNIDVVEFRDDFKISDCIPQNVDLILVNVAFIGHSSEAAIKAENDDKVPWVRIDSRSYPKTLRSLQRHKIIDVPKDFLYAMPGSPSELADADVDFSLDLHNATKHRRKRRVFFDPPMQSESSPKSPKTPTQEAQEEVPMSPALALVPAPTPSVTTDVIQRLRERDELLDLAVQEADAKIAEAERALMDARQGRQEALRKREKVQETILSLQRAQEQARDLLNEDL